MKELAQIASAVQVSSTMAMDALAKQMKADGIDVIGFGAGEPDFNTPDHIKAAADEAIANNVTRYTPASGTVALKEAVCKRMRQDCGLDYRPSQVVITSGAKHCVYIALRALVNPGDEVILPAPFWVSYLEMVRMVGGVPVVVTAQESARFKMTAEQLVAAITPKTKALILNNPCNPTGMMYSREELEAIARVCVEKDIYIISDEIYYGLVY
ncbi:MAG: aminotransferase class I/II-fold pyridoxal phosphate-dependent enzyme, partial [Clostridiales bacterium]|nr:aminotransferase class I/II-fold pyridoxal phosphate-dependent enzyme [Clostridiales bacterium]